MIITGDYRDAIAKSVRYLAELAGDDPDAAEADYRTNAAARANRPAEREVDDSGFESREDRERDRVAVDYDAELDRYERLRGLR